MAVIVKSSEVLCLQGDQKMGIFGKKRNANIPVIPRDGGEPVLRCSICTGEQVLCLQTPGSTELREIMLIRSPGELEEVCKANGLDPQGIRKVY